MIYEMISGVHFPCHCAKVKYSYHKRMAVVSFDFLCAIVISLATTVRLSFAGPTR
jgi:hypothetical protein